VEGVPEKGDLRYPTVAGTIFMGVFLGLAATVLSMWLDWGIWPFIPAAAIFLYLVAANLITVRINKHRVHARAVVEDLMAQRERDRAQSGD
jgi:hypothetical protein